MKKGFVTLLTSILHRDCLFFQKNNLLQKENDEEQREKKNSFRINYSSSLHHASYILHLHA